MKTYTINTFEELILTFEKFKDNSSYIFRGQSDTSWKLIPKAGRNEFIQRDKFGLSDNRLFRSWKRYAINYIKIKPSNDWEWYSLAQHHGLATKLLDWSKNPLIAAFFAVNDNIENDAAIYTFRIDKFIDETIYESPFDIKGFAVYYPHGISTRIIVQRGVFTISEHPEKPVEDVLKGKLHKIIIPKDLKKDIKSRLEFYDINMFSIFQDLDSLSDYLNNFTVESINLLNIKPPVG